MNELRFKLNRRNELLERINKHSIEIANVFVTYFIDNDHMIRYLMIETKSTTYDVWFDDDVSRMIHGNFVEPYEFTSDDMLFEMLEKIVRGGVYHETTD